MNRTTQALINAAEAEFNRLYAEREEAQERAGFASDPDYRAAEMGAKLSNAAMTYAFMFAGNAYMTLVSGKTGKRYTYRVSRAKDGADRWFVGVLTGPENSTDYQYLGFLAPKRVAGTGFDLVAGRKGNPAHPAFKAFDWFLRQLGKPAAEYDAMLDSGALQVWHEGRCGRCGRRLTVPSSIEAGIGPECAGRMH